MRTPALALLPLLILAACSVDDAAGPGDDAAFGVADDEARTRPGAAPADERDVDEDDGAELADADAGAEPPIVTSGGDCVVGGSYCGGDKVTGDPKTLYECNGPGTPTVLEVCAAGCLVNPGRDDSCAYDGACQIKTVPKAPYLKYGLHPDASDALVSIGFPASRITQTIGNAAASAGTHGQDGVVDGHPYSAATDLSILGMTDSQVAKLLDDLTSLGFAPYYRKPGYDGWPSNLARHMHVLWVGAPMKKSLRNQVRDWHVGKNALASHTKYTFKTWSPCWIDSIWARYLTSNSATN